MDAAATYDIFITHAWRYHDEWVKLANLLDAEKSIKWRNFSVPWYDPALDPNTALGARAIRAWIDGQIRPVVGVVLLDSVYMVKSARKWLDLEVELARLHKKPVVGLRAYGATVVSDEAAAISDAVIGWDAREIIATFERFQASQTM